VKTGHYWYISPQFLNFFYSFFQGQLEFMRERGFVVGLICSPGEMAAGFKDWPVRSYPIQIQRLTSLGRFFRATSLDELSQLVNVLRGEMSLVGPRPLPLKYLKRFPARQAIRHTVLPGITGLTATKYRGRDRSWEEKLEDDVWYVMNWKLLLDVKILFKTIWLVVKKCVLNRSGETTSEEFRP